MVSNLWHNAWYSIDQYYWHVQYSSSRACMQYGANQWGSFEYYSWAEELTNNINLYFLWSKNNTLVAGKSHRECSWYLLITEDTAWFNACVIMLINLLDPSTGSKHESWKVNKWHSRLKTKTNQKSLTIYQWFHSNTIKH